MCGELPCNPMHPGCSWSRERQVECLARYTEAQRLRALRDVDWDRAVREFQAYVAANGKESGALLKAEIKRQDRDLPTATKPYNQSKK